jgi:large subunit ribosomal protein L18
MRDKAQQSREARIRRHVRIRRKVVGTPERPRLCIFRSSRFIYAQIIDDVSHHTLAATGKVPTDLKGKLAQSKQMGQLIAKLAQEKGISQVVFDRSGYLFMGRVKALADAAREAGLKF